ncbi:hypothetical protein BDP55DRAFT_42969 [Colletotrichum godetiae]|uniref:Uncharacterized protein n=1 Tax=Colletotrichum godetiae TaxID=1209918 RepID=A0AAJ0EM25_9PEZI|nr:uncharacterized protein BDP55DRAFT_42969 [Colletotrichum godetiae]KAK1656986.1 hypothetical protein BDP55DRAFT_42969 [Colletotrichum godetiae]
MLRSGAAVSAYLRLVSPQSVKRLGPPVFRTVLAKKALRRRRPTAGPDADEQQTQTGQARTQHRRRLLDERPRHNIDMVPRLVERGAVLHQVSDPDRRRHARAVCRVSLLLPPFYRDVRPNSQ